MPRKAWALLAYLAAEPGAAQPRDRLAEILWPLLPADAARSNLRQVLLGLQKTAGGIPGLAADRHAIRLDDAALSAVDLTAFLRGTPECEEAGGERCRACLARVEAMADLYRGEFMAGFALPDCPDFEDWLLVQREALLRRALILLERLSLCHERLGNPDRALAFAQRAVDLDSWNEEGQRRLMRLLALNGLRGAALTQYEACRRMLEQELGVQPDAETQALARCLREGGVPPLAEAAAEAPALAAERRQVTVLCCQVSPAESLDPEDAMDLLRAPQTRCIHIVRQFHGHVVRTNDGGFLAYFGYPQAHEHAARLAVRAGLALTGEGFPRVCLRIGIHTGEIITGTDPNLPDTIGKTSAMAVRLRSWARPGDVVLGAATQRLVAGYFVCGALAGADPEEAFLALRESGAISRLQAAAAMTPLAGRQAELDTLRGLWQAARSGRRQALLLSGDAGIGKSRLVHALKQELSEEACLIREAQCLPEFAQTPFHPAAALLKSRLAAAPGDTPETLFRKLADYLASRFPHIDLGEAAPLFAGMLSLPVAPPYRVPGISLQAQREKVMGFLIEQVRSVAAGAPVLLVVEDLHWIDPTSLDLLSRILAATADLPLFLLCTARPGFRPPWPETAMPELRLRPLANAGIRAVISALRPGLPDAAVRRSVARADGIPLFAEELARAASGAAVPGIPSSLMDLL
ncbi:MAG: AAA family ATPase, partial [Rhodospirillaceae bacterium]